MTAFGFGIIVSMTGAVGIVLVGVLYYLNNKYWADKHLRKWRDGAEGLADWLNYSAVVDDGVVLLKSGGLVAAWRYRGIDAQSADDVMKVDLAAKMNAAFKALGAGWAINVDAVRRPAPVYGNPDRNHFPDIITALIDRERQAFFGSLGALYETELVVTLTWHPPLLVEQRFVDAMFDHDEAPETDRTESILATFRKEVANFENKLGNALSLERLRGVRQADGAVHDELLSWLHFAITGKRHPIALPPVPIYLDAVIGCQDVEIGVELKVGQKLMAAVAIDGFPSHAHAGILSALSELPIEYRWSTRFIVLAEHTALKHLKDYERKWRQKVRGIMSTLMKSNGEVNQDAHDMTREAGAYSSVIQGKAVAPGYYTSVVMLYADTQDELERNARVIEQLISNIGFTSRRETLNLFEAYLGSLPGHTNENVRRPLLDTGVLAYLMPSSTPFVGQPTAPCPLYPKGAPPLAYCVTTGGTPFAFNLHVADLGHGLLLGPTRAGKSTFLGLMVSQFRRYSEARICAFDKGQSLFPVVAAGGGQHYVIGRDGLSFCPLQFLASGEDRAWAVQWIEMIVALNGDPVTPVEREAIEQAIETMAAGTGGRRLSDFRLLVQNQRLRSILNFYTVDGATGGLLDAPKDGLTNMEFVCFELEALMQNSPNVIIPVLAYLFRRVETALDGRPTLVPIDEAWMALDNPVFRAKIRDWLKSYAKKNAAIVLSTQSLSDLTQSGILDVIIESTATKIFLPNPYATSSSRELYRRFGLSDRQIELIGAATAKQDYYVTSILGSRMVNLALGKAALAFVGATDLDSIGKMKELQAAHGGDWPEHWLRLRKVIQ